MTFKFEGQGPSCKVSSILSRPASKLHEDRKFHTKWLTMWPWLVFERDAMLCKICLKHGKKNTMTSGCKTFRTSSITRHEKLMDHKHAVSTGKLSASFKVVFQKHFVNRMK